MLIGAEKDYKMRRSNCKGFVCHNINYCSKVAAKEDEKRSNGGVSVKRQ
jgi:hypothetical protein